MTMSFRARVTAAMVLLVVVTAGVYAVLAHRAYQRYALPDALARLESSVDNLAADLRGSVRGAGNDVAALGRLSVAQRLASAPADGDAQLLADIFLAQLKAKAHYLQLRYIDADGREQVRVDRSAGGGTPRILDRDALQSKDDRPYVTSALALAMGELHTSPIEPNEEFGEIQSPLVPVLRIATPVATDEGAVGGLVIVNVDMRPTFARMRASVTGARELFLRADSDYLLHPNRSVEFARARGATSAPPDALPGTPVNLSPDSTYSSVADQPGGRLAIAARTVRPAGAPPFTIAISEPEELLIAGRGPLIGWLLLSGAGTAAIAMILAALLANSLSRPMRAMGGAVATFESTGKWRPPPVRGKEAEALATALDRMVTAEQAHVEVLQREIHNRREAEAALDRETAQLRLLSAVIESSADAIYSTTLDGTIATWNPGAQWTYGYKAEEIQGRPVSILVAEESAGEVASVLGRVVSGESIRDSEALHRTRDGRHITVSLSISPVRGATGEVTGTSAIARDITDQKSLEERFRLSVEASPAGMVVVDTEGTILLVNREIERLFGYTREELVGQPVEILVPRPIHGSHAAHRDEFASDPTRRAMGSGRELYGLRKDGTAVPVEIGLNPMETPDQTLVLASVVDISARKRTLDQLRRSNAELEQFAYVASHDLQEPLRMVANYTELLRERYEGQLDEEADLYIGFAVDGARRMQTLIADILRFSRVTATAKAMAPTDTADVVDRVLNAALVMAIRESGGTVEVGELPVVTADALQLGQVFQNLISNALKFHHEDRPPVVRVYAERQERHWCFYVSDNGIGIDPEYHDRVFEMFQRLHGIGRYPGSGIGLSLAKKIVERHEGRLDFTSEPGTGTTFFFTIPTVPARAPTEVN